MKVLGISSRAVLSAGLLLLAAFVFLSANAAQISPIRDTISTSAPAVAADHTVRIVVPGAGTRIDDADGNDRIRIVFDRTTSLFSGGIEGGMGALTADDIDVAVDVGMGLIDYTVGAGCGMGVDFGFLLDAANEEIDLLLCSGGALPGGDITAGDTVEIEIGTNATFGMAGVNQIINPAVSGQSYPVTVYLDDDAVDADFVDSGETRIMVLEPVDIDLEVVPPGPPTRTNGLPDMDLPNGTTSVVMSLNTNIIANCRYDTVAGTDYLMMPFNFTVLPNTNHETTLIGLIDDTDYTFYVRCNHPVGGPNTDDYIITFMVLPQGGGSGSSGGGGSGTGQATGSGGGGPGSSGSTGEPNPLIGNPSFFMTGWAPRQSIVRILKSGQVLAEATASITGEYSIAVMELTSGVHTVSVSATDDDGRATRALSFTFSVEPDTTTIISDVLLPPTVVLNSPTVDPGGTIEVSGMSVPSQQIEIWVSKEGATNEELRINGVVNVDGRYSGVIPINLPVGAYDVRARVFLPQTGWSEFSDRRPLGVGQDAPLDTCQRSDINQDSRVNLIDFSILLFHWTTNFPDADINSDGTVNLTDFSIQLFCWTG